MNSILRWLVKAGNFIRQITEIIYGIKTSKLEGLNTLIIVMNKTTETSSLGLLLILALKSINPHRDQGSN
jgi:hypothetical protein